MTAQILEYKIGGKCYSCSFEVTGAGSERPMIRVMTPWGTKSTHIGGLQPRALARMMAGELVTASALKL